jgi:hypothetical protein
VAMITLPGESLCEAPIRCRAPDAPGVDSLEGHALDLPADFELRHRVRCLHLSQDLIRQLQDHDTQATPVSTPSL